MNLSRRNFLKATGGAGISSALSYVGLSQAQGFNGLAALALADKQIVPVDTYVHPWMATNQTDPVGIAWVICVDNSSSIDDAQGEYQAQLDAIADTIRRDDFRESIFMPGGPGSAAVAVVDFGDSSKLLLPWIDFRESDRIKFRKVANLIENTPRRHAPNSTRHESGLKNSAICFDEIPWKCDDKHVAVMTDGTGSAEENLKATELLATRHGAVISSLITRTGTTDNIEWYKDNLTTPRNKFIGPDGGVVRGGVTVEVAKEAETQGSNTAQYKNRVFKILRDQVTMHSASLDIKPDTRVVQNFLKHNLSKVKLG